MQYQDELESGRRSIKGGMTIQAQVEHYRKKLIRKVNLLSNIHSRLLNNINKYFLMLIKSILIIVFL